MSNRELPMMPWYPDQFAASTIGWTFAERAIYRALLDLQWAQGVIPDSDLRLAKACGLHINHFRRAWKTVRSKFPRAEDGTGLRNFRLEQHRLAALKYIEGKRKGARATNAKRWSQSDEAASRSATRQRVASVSPPSPSPSEESEHPQPPQGGRSGLTANGRKPREVRDRSLEAWRETAAAIDQVAATASLPAPERLTWADLGTWVRDFVAIRAAESVGFRLIADRDKFTTADLQTRFREAYEQQLRRSREAPPGELHAS